ncbi:ABC transporter substrate-binding protein [Bacillus sp. 2205SS5-2]|uniref:ABC transporter substrate-binding protein n=1 Tax=Bacillus sp. 2205SS5-2 TaxID=3109031 RepID=UPI0030042F86
MKKQIIAVISVFVMIFLAGCGNGEGDEKDPIVVSGKNWTEQYILSHILAQYIEGNSDYKVDLQDGLGEVAVLTPALEKGDIDVYVEYTGTGLEAVLKETTEEGETAEDVLKRVNEGYQDKFKAKWLKPLGFENTYTLAYRKDENIDADTYSDLVNFSSELTFGAPHPFYERTDGYDALVNHYGFDFKDTESFDPNIMYEAVKNGDVDVITAFTTDARIDRYDLISTKDDKGLFPPYYAAPVVREETLEAYPELEDLLNDLAGQISEEDMREMNAKVDLDKETYESVAKAFLTNKGLIKE